MLNDRHEKSQDQTFYELLVWPDRTEGSAGALLLKKKANLWVFGPKLALKSTEYQTYSIKSWDEFCLVVFGFFWYLIVFWHGISGWWHGMLACNFTKIVASNFQYPLENPEGNSPLPESADVTENTNRPILPPIVVATFLGKGKSHRLFQGNLGWWHSYDIGQIDAPWMYLQNTGIQFFAHCGSWGSRNSALMTWHLWQESRKESVKVKKMEWAFTT